MDRRSITRICMHGRVRQEQRIFKRHLYIERARAAALLRLSGREMYTRRQNKDRSRSAVVSGAQYNILYSSVYRSTEATVACMTGLKEPIYGLHFDSAAIKRRHDPKLFSRKQPLSPGVPRITDLLKLSSGEIELITGYRVRLKTPVILIPPRGRIISPLMRYDGCAARETYRW